jgi:hypothetical protein
MYKKVDTSRNVERWTRNNQTIKVADEIRRSRRTLQIANEAIK